MVVDRRNWTLRQGGSKEVLESVIFLQGNSPSNKAAREGVDSHLLLDSFLNPKNSSGCYVLNNKTYRLKREIRQVGEM